MNVSKASILIIHRNGEKIIRECLESIRKNTKNVKIFILLNKTEDKSEEIIKKEFPEVIIYKSSKLIGFAKASNFLAKKAKTKYIVFLNNDVVVEKNWLDNLIKTIESHKNCVACQPKIKSYYERNKFEYAGAAGGFIDKYGYPFCRGRIFNTIEFDKGQYDNEIRIFWSCGVCLLVRRDFFINSGMFDEDFFMYAEELDFCWRANLYGKEIWYSPNSIIYHIGSYTIKTEKIKMFKEYLIHRNTLITFFKNTSDENIKKLLIRRILFELINIIVYPTVSISIIKSLCWIIKNTEKIKEKHKKIQKIRKISDENFEDLIFYKSIIFEYFLFGKKIFKQLDFNKKHKR